MENLEDIIKETKSELVDAIIDEDMNRLGRVLKVSTEGAGGLFLRPLAPPLSLILP